ncbi:hypothetical protein [Dehalobacterium formicoaceticum]|uniref:Uncharacterized protein n=1 Tax=Dehalobacterium formicoaceticum TaxID=51515 RepID=A0ABT1Y4X6_9FIRM|nr:hypothetical protein [Dehalobacterium formicoaceticum]MCR6545603.1 hypothetical protein [Dehalobacterium formicoaceticum]
MKRAEIRVLIALLAGLMILGAGVPLSMAALKPPALMVESNPPF